MAQEMTKSELNKKATKAGLAFVFVQLLVRGITFIITPIYTRLVSTEQFGELRVYDSWLLIVVPIMSLCLYRSVERAKFDFKDNFKEYVSSTLTLSYISIFTVYLIITLFFKDLFMDFCGLNDLMYVVMIFYTFSYSAMLYYQRREKQLLKYKNSTLATAATMIPATVLSVIILYIARANGYQEQLVDLRVASFYTPQIIGGLFLAVLMLKQGHFHVNTKHWKYALAFSLPLIPEMLSIQIMNQSDKIMIQKMIGSESAGIFSLATTVSFIIWIIEDAVWGAWQPWLYEKIDRKEIEDIGKPWYTIAYLFGYFSWMLVVLAPEIIYIFGGKGYEAAIYLVSPMVTGTLFRFFSNCFTAVENYQKKTQYSAMGTVGAMIINVILNYICIQKFGYQAAAYTTAISYFALLCIQGMLEKKVCGMRVVSLGKMAALSAAFWAINEVTAVLFSVEWYFRWLVAIVVSVIMLVKFYPVLINFLKTFKKK